MDGGDNHLALINLTKIVNRRLKDKLAEVGTVQMLIGLLKLLHATFQIRP